MTKNQSGIWPTEYKCVVLPEKSEEKSDGGIIIPDPIREKHDMATVYARLIACGGNAFEDWKDPVPKADDRILIAKYAGKTFERGGVEYRLINDKDIAGVIYD